MSEQLLNKDFNSDLSYWNNSGQYWDNGKSRGDSYPYDMSEKTTIVKQSFSVYNTVLTATISVLAYIRSYAGVTHNGHVMVRAWLEKPDGSKVALRDETREGNWSGDVALLTAYDVAAIMNQVGTYSLILETVAAAGYSFASPPGIYYQTYGAFDSTSFLVTVRATKSVAEKIGGGDGPHPKGKLAGAGPVKLAQLAAFPRVLVVLRSALGLAQVPIRVAALLVAEILGLKPAYTTNKTKFWQSLSGVGFVGGAAKRVSSSASGAISGTGTAWGARAKISVALAGLLEALSHVWRPCINDAGPVGLDEGLVAKESRGNVDFYWIITGDAAAWETVAAHVTRWRKHTAIVS